MTKIFLNQKLQALLIKIAEFCDNKIMKTVPLPIINVQYPIIKSQRFLTGMKKFK